MAAGLTRKEYLYIIEAFKSFDLNQNGEIDTSELKTVFSQLGVQITQEEAQKFVNFVDYDGNGTLN